MATKGLRKVLRSTSVGPWQDDGKRAWARDLAADVACQLATLGRRVTVCYTARPKRAGVPHHSKAGNINHALLKSPDAHADFVLVLDCDMIVKAEFLRETVPHFFEQGHDGIWQVKEKAAFLQRFHNLGHYDPWWHSSEDFNSVGFQGHDGLGAVPCVGTGCLFSRSCLVAMGGQSLHSVTEDYKTGFNALSNGFSTMYLYRCLVYGLAVDDCNGIHRQRTRWATGAMQILAVDNPLCKPGLTFAQTACFFANALGYLLSFCYLLAITVPLGVLWTHSVPVRFDPLEGGCALFIYITASRCFDFWKLRYLKCSRDFTLWRGSQMSVWMLPLAVEALTLFAWNAIKGTASRAFGAQSAEVAFKVSPKAAGATPWPQVLRVTWLPWTYLVLLLGGIAYNGVQLALGMVQADWALARRMGLALFGGSYCLCMLFPMMGTALDEIFGPYWYHEKKGSVSWELREKAQQVQVIVDDVGPGPDALSQPLLGPSNCAPGVPIRNLYPGPPLEGKPYETASSSGSDTVAAALLQFVGGGKPSDASPDPSCSSSGYSEIEGNAMWDPCDGASPTSWSVSDEQSSSSKALLSSPSPSTDSSDLIKEQDLLGEQGEDSQGQIPCESSFSAAQVSQVQGSGRGSSAAEVLSQLAAVRDDPTQPSIDKLPLFHLVPLQRRSFYYILSNALFVGMWVGCGIALAHQQQ